jgi:iron complex transport system substrate-binding protein
MIDRLVSRSLTVAARGTNGTKRGFEPRALASGNSFTRCTRVVLALLLLAAAAVAQPRRIVSTAPSITEMLYALGLGDRVVGVTVYCHYPPEAAKKPKIGTYTEPNLEVIAALKPDLVIIQKNPVQLQAKLERLGLHVLEVRHDNIAEVLASITAIGQATGATAAAANLVAKLRRELDDIHARVAKVPRATMMFVVGRAPGRIEDIIVIGRASYLNDIIQVAGGINAFRDSVAPYPKVGMEEILSRNPDVIVDMGDMTDTAGVTQEQKRAVVALWDRYPSLSSVRNHRVFAVASDIFVVPGPRMVDAAREFARMLHPGVKL